MESGLVSVMMPAYNAERYIAQAIDSVVAQSYIFWELIVVDDGSTDGTASIVASFSDPRIKLVREINNGEAAARNTALGHMRGEFIGFLDADDLYLPDHLQVAVDCLQRNPEADGVYTDGYYCDANARPLKTLSSRRRGPFEGRVFDEVIRGSDLFGPPLCVVLRSKPSKTYNLQFDENIIIGPDWVFFMEYANVACFKYVEHCTCLYRLHQTNITSQVGLPKRAQELAKCRIRAIKMNNFNRCPLDVRTTVFYDLLVNLLRDHPEKQMEIIQWPEFLALPLDQQARILRLMAGAAMVHGEDNGLYVRGWLDRASNVYPNDLRNVLLCGLYGLSPRICVALIRTKYRGRYDPLSIPPFADLIDS